MEQFAELIKEAAQVVGIETARVWPDLVAVYWIKNVVSMCVMPIAAIISLSLCSRFGLSFSKALKDRDDFKSVPSLLGVITSGLIGVVMVISLLISSGTMIAAVVYPEASLVQGIIDKAK